MARDEIGDGEGDFDGDSSNQKVSPTLTPEKGNRNKRKFKPDCSSYPSQPETSYPLPKFHDYENFEEKCKLSLIRLQSMTAKAGEPKEDDAAAIHAIDWDDPNASELETLLSNNLHANFQAAITKIVESGYSEQAACLAVLSSGPFYGPKDMVSNIVDNALGYLSDENKEGVTPRFETLQSLVDFMILEMVYMLIHMKPSLSVTEAMWNLLICDLDLSHACEEGDPLKFPLSGGAGVQAEGSPTENPSQSESPHQGPITSNLNKPNTSKSLNPNPGSSKSEEKNVEEKSGSGKKGFSGNAQRRDSLRHKAFHFEKTYKGRMSKGSFKAKLNTWGGLVLDKKQKSPSDSSSVTTKNYMLPSKDSKPVPVTVSASSTPGSSMPKEKAKSTANPEANTSPPPKTADYYLATIPYDETQGKYLPQDNKDKMILAAVARVQSLQKEIQSWEGWANLKVMQATKRLTKDRAELKMLRAEKEENEKLKNDKQVLEESTLKRLSEMTQALNTANCQIEMANSAVSRLELENTVIKTEMEAARSRSSLEATKLAEARLREQETLKKSQSFGSEKESLDAELKALKRQAATRKQEVEKLRGHATQIEVQRAYEEREKTKLLNQAESIRMERDRLEAFAKAEEKRTTEKAEKELKKYEDDMKRIQYEISALKLETETKKIAAMRKGMNWHSPDGTKRLDIPRNNIGERSMKQERDSECVMCLTNERTLVFLPCAHQVLCVNCNEIHEKNGMKDCPSCRTPIQTRVLARFAKS